MNAESYQRFYESDDLKRFGREEMPEQGEVTARWLERCRVSSEARVVELGCGVGPISGIHPGYIGLEFSGRALRAFPRLARRVNADMQRLPFKDDSVDFIFSWAAIEHVPRPEQVFEEVSRALKPGGVAVLAPAWNCRPWAAKGLPIRRYGDLGLADKLRKVSIPLRNHILWRAAWAVPSRLLREGMALLGPTRFDYKRLEPNLEEYVYTDCDAFTSMDPHAAILFFETRGWQVLSHPTVKARVTSRHEPVVVRKPNAGP
jgi:SAM-dependent methyltransferase